MSANDLYLAATERESDLYVGTATLPLRIIEADYNILNISTPIHGDLHLEQPHWGHPEPPLDRCATCDGGGCPDCTDTDW